MDLPVITFIQERLAEVDSSLETRTGTPFYDLFVKPQQLMLQPLLDAMDVTLTAQSVRRVLALDAPDDFNEEFVDDLAANQYVTREVGGKATATVRIFYQQPADKEFPAYTAQFSSNSSLNYFNSEPILITLSEMAINQIGSLYYVDVAVEAEAEGTEYNQSVGGITAFVNDADAVSVTNITEAEGGLPRETNTQLLERTKNSIGVRDLETVKGINAILYEKFPYLRKIQTVGMGDPEMMRDIVYNAHVGGKTDIYVKTPSLQTRSKKFIGLTFDTTREVERSVNKELLATSSTDPLASLGTPLIVTNSGNVKVLEDVVETSAKVVSALIPPAVGIDLTGAEWIKIQLDTAVSGINIKVSGANVTNTQRFEIINSINAALGETIAFPYGSSQLYIKSQKVGASSKIKFLVPDLPRTDATLTLFPLASGAGYPTVGTFSGVAATEYVETVDFSIDYNEGKIWKLPGSAIKSGDLVVPASTNGAITNGSYLFNSPIAGAFTYVREGDELIITSSIGVASGSYYVRQKISNQQLRLHSFSPYANDSAVNYSIKSHQVVKITYKYNPLSIDIGANVLLSDGKSRGIRPGRETATITDTAFLNIISIEEIDPDTEENLGIFLTPPGGYGVGGYGQGAYGVGDGQDYEFRVNEPTARYSYFEDSMLLFNSSLFGKSYEITYYCASEIATIHALCRNDLERVTGADILPKNFVPGFVDMDIKIKRDATNIATPDNDALATLVKNYVESLTGLDTCQASEINKILENQGVDRVVDPFTMQVTVVNTDGSTSIYRSEDALTLPSVTLLKDTPNFVTPKITHFYPRNITVSEIS